MSTHEHEPSEFLTKGDLKFYLGPIASAIDDMRADMNRRFDDVDRRFDQVDRRFDQVDGRFEQVDGRFEQMENRLLHIEKRYDGQIENVGTRIDRVWVALVGGLGAIVAVLISQVIFG